ncbi:arsenate reductase ArsC [Microbacterium paludicola]|uniref:arsenate reductase ArsC n=1 Tax=Microbacterium paludicola TaxID=300019 RepID=UPI0031D961C1
MSAHRIGRPLDVDEAQARARQAAVLGEALHLRVLSAIAAGAPSDALAEVLHVSAERALAARDVLRAAGMIHTDESGAAELTADAWVRFGRMLAVVPPHAPEETEERPIVALPPAIESVARDLAYRFGSTFSPQTVSRYVAESYLLLSQRAKAQGHLATLTARYAAERLDALATSTSRVLRGTPEVLFVCVQNAGRSQIAAAYMRHLAGGAVHVRTAGSAPRHAVHPRIHAVLEEAGVPITDDFPKPLTDEVVRAADYVITMGCGDACPVYPGRRYMEWEMDDPLLLDDAGLRGVRDGIRARVEDLLEEMRVL